MTVHNLPRQSTTFVGRNRELAEISALLADPNCQLLTLLGPGGIGKTRLALQAAADQLSFFEDGVYFVALAPVSSPDLLSAAIASAIGTSFYGAEDHTIQLARFLREKQMLLVIDNIEHLLDGVDLLTELLQATADVKFLVTSRERLNIQEEWVFAVDGLSFPQVQSDEPLESYSAVQLFVQRAHQIQTHFSLTENAEAVKAICQKMEGMPLGLELAATWLRVMPCQQIALQIGSGLDFLTTPLRNIPERHRSLRMVFEQSWRFLSDDEQSVLMKLSVFRGGFDLESSEQVAGASLAILAELADKSLIRLNSSGRYDLHELLRQYAADKLLDTGGTQAAIQHHFNYFLKLAERAEAHNFGRDQIGWFNRLEVELDNIRAALAWSIETESGLRFAAALCWFFSERSHWIEGLDWLERTLAANQEAPNSLRAKALHSAAPFASFLGDDLRGRAYCEQALALARAANDRWNIAWSLSHLGFYGELEYDQAAAALEESLTLFRAINDSMGLSHTLIRRTFRATQQLDYPYARLLLEEAAGHAHEFDDKIISAWVDYLLGVVTWVQNHDLKQAKIYYESSVSFFRQAHFLGGVSLSLGTLGLAEHALGDDAHAQTSLMEALILLREMASYSPVTLFLAGLASIARARGELLWAARILGAVDSTIMLDAAKTSRGLIVTFDSDVTLLRSQLGETAFAEAWAAGKAMTKEQAVAYALEDRTTPTETVNNLDTTQHHQSTSPASIEALSTRELEVLRLIAEGLSNAEIAQKLFLTVGTVKVHSRNIYGKLGANNRTQAVAQAQKLNLL